MRRTNQKVRMSNSPVSGRTSGRSKPTGPSVAKAGATRWGRRASLLRQSGLSEAGEIGGFKQSVDFRNAPISVRLHLGDARKRTFAQQPAGLVEFVGGTISLAFERVGRGKPEVWTR